MKMIKEGVDSFYFISQTDDEAKMLLQFMKGVVPVRVDNGQPNTAVAVRFVPDISTLVAPKTSEYDKLSTQDLLTKAVELGIEVDKNAIREDLIRVIEESKSNPERAKEMAAKVRPVKAKRSLGDHIVQGNGGGFEYSAKSTNA